MRREPVQSPFVPLFFLNRESQYDLSSLKRKKRIPIFCFSRILITDTDLKIDPQREEQRVAAWPWLGRCSPRRTLPRSRPSISKLSVICAVGTNLSKHRAILSFPRVVLREYWNISEIIIVMKTFHPYCCPGEKRCVPWVRISLYVERVWLSFSCNGPPDTTASRSVADMEGVCTVNLRYFSRILVVFRIIPPL